MIADTKILIYAMRYGVPAYYSFSQILACPLVVVAYMRRIRLIKSNDSYVAPPLSGLDEHF
jgi:hypothetical protein